MMNYGVICFAPLFWITWKIYLIYQFINLSIYQFNGLMIWWFIRDWNWFIRGSEGTNITETGEIFREGRHSSGLDEAGSWEIGQNWRRRAEEAKNNKHARQLCWIRRVHGQRERVQVSVEAVRKRWAGLEDSMAVLRYVYISPPDLPF